MRFTKLKLPACYILIISYCASFTLSVNAQTHKRHTSNNDLIKAKQTTIGFLKWYSTNLSKFEKMQSNLIAGTIGDSTKPYRINFDSTEVYLKELGKRGYVSEEYLDHFRPLFKSVDESLIKNKQWDGPIIGFEWDLIFNVIETDEITTRIDKLKTVYQFGDLARALVIYKLGKSLHLIFVLRHYQGKWLIDEFCARYI